ncbi:putative CAD protein-like [Sesbania bispinosa]|nr:putative CAD protein-like [Sesbania bispinosa]
MFKSVTLINRPHYPSPCRPPTTPFLSRVFVVPPFRVTSCRRCRDQSQCRSPLFSHPLHQHPSLFNHSLADLSQLSLGDLCPSLVHFGATSTMTIAPKLLNVARLKPPATVKRIALLLPNRIHAALSPHLCPQRAAAAAVL